MVAALTIVAAACGGAEAADSGAAPAFPGDGAAPGETFRATRTAMGMSAAGGNPRRSPACAEAGAPQALDTVKIAWVGPDLAQLAAVGLETLALDDPSLIVSAYVNEVNSHGGINGSCFELVAHQWDLADPDASFRRICTDLPEQQPLVLLSLWTNDATLRCGAVWGQIPTIGIFTSLPDSALQMAAGHLFLDSGSVEYLMLTSLEVAAGADVLTEADRVGLLTADGAGAAPQTEAAQAAIERLGLEMVAVARVPNEFGSVGVSVAEHQVRLLESGLTDSEIEEGLRAFALLSPEQAEVLRQMERFFLGTVEELRAAGATTVVSSAASADVRRLMRAADRLGWRPRWIANDSQHAILMLTGAPPQQGRNLMQVSSRRAAGDPVPDPDRGCVSLRNTSTGAPPFPYRVHTDAWNLITATCDSLDVVFGAMTRVAGPLTREALIDALGATDYETAHGSRITFGPDDRNGPDRFRVLQADPDCVLDEWGCMRAASGWFGADGRIRS